MHVVIKGSKQKKYNSDIFETSKNRQNGQDLFSNDRKNKKKNLIFFLILFPKFLISKMALNTPKTNFN